MLSGMDHSWRRLRGLPDWLLRWRRLPGAVEALTDHASRTIWMDPRLLQVERRCAIAHELEHVARGPVPPDPVLAAREEAAIDRAVARRLIPLEALGEALAWSRHLDEVADELWVDRPTLEVRLASLHPAERAHLRRRLAHQE